MDEKTRFPVLVLLVAGLLLVPTLAQAQDLDFGVRVGYYSDVEEGFLGFELLRGFGRGGHWFFNPNLEWVFIDGGDYATLNGDVHYDFDTEGPFAVWVGGGPALVYNSFDRPRRFRDDDDSETDFGFNILAGVGSARRAAIRPYLQGKILLSDDTEAVIAVGVRFD
jgi:hypothetical protein